MKINVKEEIEQIVEELKRTVTSKPIPRNIGDYNSEDSWNASTNHCIKELEFLLSEMERKNVC